MFGWLKKQKKVNKSTRVEAVYGFEAGNIDGLAKSLESALRIRLYSHQSPMIGPWYSSHDLDSIAKAARNGGRDAAKEVAEKIESQGIPGLEIVENDPDPYRGGPEIPNGGEYLLRVVGVPQQVRRIEKRLSLSDLAYRKLR